MLQYLKNEAELYRFLGSNRLAVIDRFGFWGLISVDEVYMASIRKNGTLKQAIEPTTGNVIHCCKLHIGCVRYP